MPPVESQLSFFSDDTNGGLAIAPSVDNTRGSSQAPGQYLGYSLQPTRFLSHLLDAEPDWTVSLELFEDTGIETPKGHKVAEQAKSNPKSNPISDHAVDFWKTINNWICAIDDGQLDVSKTSFVLYTSHPRRGVIAESFGHANNYLEALDAFQNAKNSLLGDAPTYPLRVSVAQSIAPYIEKVFYNTDQSIILNLIVNFKLAHGNGSPQTELRRKMRKVWVPPDLVDDLLVYAQGWVKEQIDLLLEKQEPATITVESFHTAMMAFIRKHDNRTILNTFAAEPSVEEINHELKYKIYVQQLDIIDLDDSCKIRAVTDFLRASTDRTTWSKKGLVDSSSFVEFEEGLITTWNNTRMKTDILLASNSQEDRGKYLYYECIDHQLTITGLQLPLHFVPGSYHTLADNKIIGWHPDYKRKLSHGDE